MPKISVVMPTYNSIQFLKSSIESILNQTFMDFELIIVDDGSNDGSSEMIDDFRKHDNRIYVCTNSTNLGIVASLNLGLSFTNGQYIARMDADDICYPTRFQKQIAFLDENPDIGILGCAVNYINSDGKTIGTISYPLGDIEIRWTCLFSNPFAHPTVMIRKCVLEKNNLRYDPLKQNIEDYDLWVRLLTKTKGANLKEVLLKYRIHPESITSNYKEKDYELLTGISLNNISELYPSLNITNDEVRIVVTSLVGHQDYRSQDSNRLKAGIIYLNTWKVFSLKYKAEEIRSLKKKNCFNCHEVDFISIFSEKFASSPFMFIQN
jgi:glycosyltransferase involved in cell wall biosynthesis